MPYHSKYIKELILPVYFCSFSDAPLGYTQETDDVLCVNCSVLWIDEVFRMIDCGVFERKTGGCMGMCCPLICDDLATGEDVPRENTQL